MGSNLLALYGTMNQLRRMEIYDQFCRKSHSILLSTDLASRGLDFPNINWVVQVDCPIDVNTYIHRVGRTARYEKNGQALLLLTPSESNVFVGQLESKKISVENLKVNQKYLVNIEVKLQGLCASNIELKESVSMLSVFLTRKSPYGFHNRSSEFTQDPLSASRHDQRFCNSCDSSSSWSGTRQHSAAFGWSSFFRMESQRLQSWC